MAEVPAQEKRRHERYPIYCPLEYKAEDDHPKETANTLNISEGGALISASRNLTVGANVIIKVKLRDESFFIIGQVKHIKREEDDGAYSVGVEFWDKPRTFTRRFYQELEEIKGYQQKQSQEQGKEVSLQEASVNWFDDSKELLQQYSIE